ncbi:MAG: DUF5916 domain-containing protein [Bacteroidales bacterium]|jgi:hypothetical protein|nr:DUF5916 domain-containing protein [Bacteroidales bacterium]
MLLLVAVGLNGQVQRKQVAAYPVQTRIQIDGLLDEAAWQQAPVAGDFVQFEPYNGAAPTEITVVKILYDDAAIYIGATMYDSAPDSILTELGFRDADNLNADYIIFSLSPYNDGLNASAFGVTASGVQLDARIYNDDDDEDWDAVWMSHVSHTDSGWTAEVKIPYSALRFPENDVQTWGFNAERSIRRKREIDTWNFIDKNIKGRLKQAGEITQLYNIRPPLRLSLTPYVSAYLEKLANDPSWGFSFNYGIDLKYGINESFTLDMTLIPDFGQVQSDDQIFNLSPFEVYYQERRPFFTEGTELFGKGNIFYSRRVGDVPDGYAAVYDSLQPGEMVTENPAKTRLLNATKISGRTGKGLGIGVFNAFSGQTTAIITDSLANQREIITQPFTNYNMVVLDQSMKHNSFLSFYNTNVYKGKAGTTANVTGAEFQFFNKPGEYSVDGRFNLSQKYHPSEAADLGYAYNVSLNKTSGPFRFSLTRWVETDTYDPNDLGYLEVNNEITHNLQLHYNFYNPFWRLLELFNTLTIWYQTRYEPNDFTEFGIFGSSRGTFRNHLTIGFDFELKPVEGFDYYEARTPGRVFVKPPDYEFNIFLSPDYRKPFIVDLRAGYDHSSRYAQNEFSGRVSPRWRVNDRLSINLSSSYKMEFNDIGFVDRTYAEPPEIIFGSRDLQTVENIISTTYIFSNMLALDFRMRHYWLSAKYNRFYDLDAAGKLQATHYDENNDFSFNAFNIDMNLRWQFAPGSELALSWKNAILTYNRSDITDRFFGNLHNTLQAPSDNSLSLKVLYYLDYSYLKKK